MIFGFRGLQDVHIHQNLLFENFIQRQYIFYHTWVREDNKNEIFVKLWY